MKQRPRIMESRTETHGEALEIENAYTLDPNVDKIKIIARGNKKKTRHFDVIAYGAKPLPPVENDKNRSAIAAD